MFRQIKSVNLVSIKAPQSLGKSGSSPKQEEKPKKFVSKYFQKGSKEVI